MPARFEIVSGLVAVSLVTLACAPATEMTGVWRDPTFEAKPASRVLVIGIGKDEVHRRMFETVMAEKLRARKLDAVMSFQVSPQDEPLEATLGRRVVLDQGIDLISVTRLVGVGEETHLVPETTVYKPGSGAYAFYPYYDTNYALAHEPGYLQAYKIVIVETNVYDARREKLVWSGQSKTFDPRSPQDGIESVSNTLVRNMARSGIIP